MERWQLLLDNNDLEAEIRIDNDNVSIVFADELEDDDPTMLDFDEFGYSLLKELCDTLELNADFV